MTRGLCLVEEMCTYVETAGSQSIKRDISTEWRAGQMNPGVLDLNWRDCRPWKHLYTNVLAAFTGGASTHDTQRPNPDR